MINGGDDDHDSDDGHGDDGDEDHGDDNDGKTQMLEIHRCFQAPTIYNCFHSKYCAQAFPYQSKRHHRAATFQ